MQQQKFDKELESYRLEADYLKHLTTLSTAAILVVLALYDKFTGQGHTTYLLIALLGFLFTTASALYVHFRLAWVINDEDLEEPTGRIASMFDFVCMIGGLVTFFTSISLLVFVVYGSINP